MFCLEKYDHNEGVGDDAVCRYFVETALIKIVLTSMDRPSPVQLSYTTKYISGSFQGPTTTISVKIGQTVHKCLASLP